MRGQPQRETVRLWASLSIAGVVAVAMIAFLRWRTFEVRPGTDSDLDMPSLFGSTPANWEGIPLEGLNDGIPVLCYHYFRPGVTPARFVRVLGAVLLNMPSVPANDFWTNTVPEFERQMRWLHDNGYRTITMDELVDWMDGGPHPGKAVVLTFDDGDRSVLDHAVPVLRRYGFQGTLFLLTGRVGTSGWNHIEFADWDELRALEHEGVLRVESHTHRMHRKHRVGGEAVPDFLLAARDSAGRVVENSRLARDLAATRSVIRRELGRESTFLAWPFGFGDAVVDSVALASGFRRVLTLRPERNLPDFEEIREEDPPGTIGRYAITARTSLQLLRLMVEH
ncbi:polysaccharide deacetylase family protein [bacterium]|nr:polysaccharide deacetylase family protein [bacterium]